MEDASPEVPVPQLDFSLIFLQIVKVVQLHILLETVLIVVDLDVRAVQQLETLFLTSVVQIGFVGLHAL